MIQKTKDGILFFKKQTIGYFTDKPANGDEFFKLFGVGNGMQDPTLPFERYREYESLLLDMKQIDPVKFKAIHKGMAYYFLAWTAFDMGNYETTMFHILSSISEDIKKDPVGWKKNPMYLDLTLEKNGGGSALRMQNGIQNAVYRDYDIYKKSHIKKNNIDEKKLISTFVDNFIEDNSQRSMISSFYSFILEYDNMRNLLKIRSTYGGSIEPFLLHLFKGGLLFESLLKQYNKKIIKHNTLGKILEENNIKEKYKHKKADVRANTFSDIINYNGGNVIDNYFNITAKIRNFTGHDLSRDDRLTVNIFDKLYKKIIASIFYLIELK